MRLFGGDFGSVFHSIRFETRSKESNICAGSQAVCLRNESNCWDLSTSKQVFGGHFGGVLVRFWKVNYAKNKKIPKPYLLLFVYLVLISLFTE